jgi:3-oxoacyl-(acyl-carrier-protein) synthase
MANCIQLALKDAKIAPKDIDYVNAHGSSTRMNDVFETNAYKIALGEEAYRVPISSLKSMIGHPLAAANAIEMVMASIIFERNLIPPTINQEVRDPQCDLNYVPNKAIEKKVDLILKTSSGFSGIHSSLVMKRCEK